ncbi:hypothetical protein B0I37DRAFT_380964 [Chaetomium sp. MPI-CAGE-AT-0009]|nr:hypothetical protein B0I37DRAFT_380964 [Chaetomium sp. MPI-CAGE-AT-0009]
MKAVTTFLLTLATLAFAAPNPNAGANPAVLSTQQGESGDCTYSCQCHQDGHGAFNMVRTRVCCFGIGTLAPKAGEAACNLSSLRDAEQYARCCGWDRNQMCQASRPDCPAIRV